MSADERQLIRLMLRNDLSTFIHRTFQTVTPAQPYLHNWHIEAMAWHLEQCAKGAIKRLVITLPPRYGKSICASVAFPAWVLGRESIKNRSFAPAILTIWPVSTLEIAGPSWSPTGTVALSRAPGSAATRIWN